MDDKARIAELEGMVAVLWKELSDECASLSGEMKESGHGEAMCPKENPCGWCEPLWVLKDTKVAAEAHDARIERKGMAKGLREAIVSIPEDCSDTGCWGPQLCWDCHHRKEWEAKADKLEKEVG